MVNFVLNTSIVIIICFFMISLLTKIYQILCTTPKSDMMLISFNFRDFFSEYMPLTFYQFINGFNTIEKISYYVSLQGFDILI